MFEPQEDILVNTPGSQEEGNQCSISLNQPLTRSRILIYVRGKLLGAGASGGLRHNPSCLCLYFKVFEVIYRGDLIYWLRACVLELNRSTSDPH